MTVDESFHQKLWDLIQHIRFAMLTHRHPGGGLHAHPLTTQGKSLRPGEPLCFFVSRKTELGQRVRSDPSVCIAYADPAKDRYVSITGKARVSEDLAKKKSLFNALAKAWFPGGAEDPDLELLEVDIEHAEYWDVKESKTTQVLKLAAAAVSGQRPEMGEHRELHVAAASSGADR
jgi:general stress protein 26